MRLLNVGIVAHADAGKTTVTEQLLYLCGQVAAPGRVDHGNTASDVLGFERQRGISARASVIALQKDDVRLHLLDTPGHVDFIHQVEQSLAALDAAVLVVSAVEGLQGQTLALYRVLRDMGVPVVVFLNKVDRVGSDAAHVMAQMQKTWQLPVACLNRLTGEGERSAAVQPLQGNALLEEVARLSDSAAEAFLLEEPVAGQTCTAWLCEGILARRGLCVVQGAALLGRGVDQLLQLLCALAQPPAEVDAPPLGYVFQVRHDAVLGAAALVRMFRGTLRNRDSILVQGHDQADKITQIRTVAAKNPKDIGSVSGGDVAAIYGLANVRTGDVLGSGTLPRTCSMTVPVMQAQVLPQDESELPRLVEAIAQLCREDPMLEGGYLPQQKELHVSITGKLQLELLGALLQERFRLAVTFAPPRVIYRETVQRADYGFAEYTMPKPCWAIVRLQIEPLPRGSGVVLETTAEDRNIMRRYQNHVLQCLPEAMKQGLFGWQVTDVKITLTDGQHHLIHTHPLDFFVATPMALMDGLTRCGVKLLEPMLYLRITGPAEALPRLTGELLAMRATLLDSARVDDRFEVQARAPVATAMDFPARLSALTGGHGVLEQRFDGYDDAPPDVQAERTRMGVDPRDRSKWILACRNAL